MAHAADAAAQGEPMSGTPQVNSTSDDILAVVMEILNDNKAEEIVQFDLRGKTSVCDHMVICSGRSSRQVAALAEMVMDALKTRCGVLSKTEGKQTGDWVLIDSGDVVVHVFRPEVREFYQLEKMWQPGAAPATRA
ncbi:MAG: ribosome silencing factor [Pelagimonas sp.]